MSRVSAPCFLAARPKESPATFARDGTGPLAITGVLFEHPHLHDGAPFPCADSMEVNTRRHLLPVTIQAVPCYFIVSCRVVLVRYLCHFSSEDMVNNQAHIRCLRKLEGYLCRWIERVWEVVELFWTLSEIVLSAEANGICQMSAFGSMALCATYPASAPCRDSCAFPPSICAGTPATIINNRTTTFFISAALHF